METNFIDHDRSTRAARPVSQKPDFAPPPSQGQSGATAPSASGTSKSNTPNEISFIVLNFAWKPMCAFQLRVRLGTLLFAERSLHRRTQRRKTTLDNEKAGRRRKAPLRPQVGDGVKWVKSAIWAHSASPQRANETHGLKSQTPHPISKPGARWRPCAVGTSKSNTPTEIADVSA